MLLPQGASRPHRKAASMIRLYVSTTISAILRNFYLSAVFILFACCWSCSCCTLMRRGCSDVTGSQRWVLLVTAPLKAPAPLLGKRISRPVPAPPLMMVVALRPDMNANRCNEAAAGATDNRRGTAPTECVKQNRRRTAVECLDSAVGNIEVPFKS